MNEENYYTSTGRKVGDFCMGFFGTFIAGLIGVPVAMLGSLVALGGCIYLAYYFMKKTNRRYIGIGIISALSLILVLFGGCLLIISNIY